MVHLVWVCRKYWGMQKGRDNKAVLHEVWLQEPRRKVKLHVPLGPLVHQVPPRATTRGTGGCHKGSEGGEARKAGAELCYNRCLVPCPADRLLIFIWWGEGGKGGKGRFRADGAWY